MSDNNHAYTGSTFWQLILVIPGSILAFTLIISLIAKSAGGNAPVVADTAAIAKIDEAIKPLAVVELAAPDAASHVDKSGEEVVKAVCAMCHGAGLMNSPKIGDKDAWAPRIAQGYDTLVNNAINGIRAMPAKGGNAALTEGEIASAVALMANAGGANFTASTPKAAEAAKETPKAPAEASAPMATPAAETKKEATSSTDVKRVEVKAIEKSTVAVAAPEKAVVAEVKAVPVATASTLEVAEPAKSGKDVFKTTCAMCHGTGLMNAPKLGDKEQWAPRVAQGYDTLVKHAIEGIRTMPAKGGNEDWSDKEIAAAVKYMANEAGAGF